MTAAEQLRQASETLRRLAEEATQGPWEPSHDKPSPHRPPDTYDVWGPDIYSLPYDDAALIALMDPDLARLLAAALATEAHAAEVLAGRVANKELLALAEHINERTSR